ncbi:MAG: TetR/AcrR family transcriptional regulator [Treponema sp.]|jgi:AcrR family transcriptional regulator|nr:TetR/AcrR family transcriptional regulator [Treponema sp.]
MPERKIPETDNDTRNRILDEAIKLAALKGFNNVSLREIAKAVRINMSAIYYYYSSKDTLLDGILSRFESGYRDYFEWLTEVNREAETLDELMDNLFNKEFLEMSDPMGCLGMSLLIKEQHNNEAVRNNVFRLFFEYSVQLMQADFDRLAEKGLISLANTQTIATLIMFCVITNNDLRIHEYTGVKPPINSKEMLLSLKNFITQALEKK